MSGRYTLGRPGWAAEQQERASIMSLVVTGTVGIDTVVTPSGAHAEGVLGGSAAYFAAASSFYTPVRIVAVVGDDMPAEHRELLDRFPNVDASGLEVRAGSTTFRWGGKYLDNMDHRETLFTELGVLNDEPPRVPGPYADSQFVFLANTHPKIQLDMLGQFPQRRLAVADTMDLWIESARDELLELLTRVDGLVLNYDEAEQLSGKTNTVAAARHLLTLGPRFVVVKKGEHGCIFVHRDGIAAQPAYPAQEVLDPTGAGDAFAGAMMGHIAAGVLHGRVSDPSAFDTIRRALAHGTVVASFNIESFSLFRLASLTQEQLDRRFDEFVHMIDVL